MAIYNYTGLDRSGKEIKSTVNSESINGAKQKLKSMGIMLIDIREQKTKKNDQSVFSFRGRVPVGELSLMTRQLATLVKAKIQIVEALNALMNQVDNNTLRVVLSEIKQSVNEGSSLAKSLSQHPKIFDNVYVNMVEAGEASGTLEIVLNRLAEFTEAQVKLRNKIKKAMFYPVVMSVFGFAMMNVIFIFVIPKIAKIFESNNKKLPWMTELSIGISHFLQDYWWLLIFGMFFIYYLFKKYTRTKNGERNWHSFILKIPMINKLTRMINVSRFCSTLATLLNSGVPILTSIKIIQNLIPNVWIKDAIEKAKESVSEGKSMTPPLDESGQFPKMVTHMIYLGEQSGELEPMLEIIAENYEEQVEANLDGLASVLEPIMLIVMGLVVAFIVFSVIIPMMEMTTVK